MVLGELAQAAADGSSDIGLDEIGMLLAARFVEIVSGRTRKPPKVAAARSPPRGGGGAVDRCERARADRSRQRGGRGRAQRLSLSAALRESSRRDAAPISGALPAAPRGAAAGRQRRIRSPTSRSTSGSATSPISCARSIARPASRRAASAGRPRATARFSKIGSRRSPRMTSDQRRSSCTITSG